MSDSIPAILVTRLPAYAVRRQFEDNLFFGRTYQQSKNLNRSPLSGFQWKQGYIIVCYLSDSVKTASIYGHNAKPFVSLFGKEVKTITLVKHKTVFIRDYCPGCSTACADPYTHHAHVLNCQPARDLYEEAFSRPLYPTGKLV